MWVGNVEIHDKASDWYVHGHEKDAHYNNVVLHVVEQSDITVKKTEWRYSASACIACSTICKTTL